MNEINETVHAEITATDGSLSFTADREITLAEVRAMIARAQALGVPTDAVVTRFELEVYGATQMRCSLRWVNRQKIRR